jgi:D-beta-D-heptose 7-phosphate kinase/D-beta-D-heptose 1-phosphate adenosyltransferase
MKILLLGDVCIDEYHYGVVERISPEAPVPIFTEQSYKSFSGMAGNVERNLINLGLNVTAIFGNNVSLKIRYIEQRHNHHIIRIDRDLISERITLPDNLDYDAIVISDYNKGSIDSSLLKDVEANFTGPIFIDTKITNLGQFQSNNMVFKINQGEYNKLTSLPNQLIVTLGDRGAMYNEAFYSTQEVEVIDSCGAGDTFLAALTYQFLQTGDIGNSIEFANKASSITIRHPGVYAPTLEEICN